MSVIIKTQELQYKDQAGNYHGINAVAEKKIADQEAALDAKVAACQSAINTLETQKNAIAETVAAMADLGTDTSLSTPGMAADAAKTGGLKNVIKNSLTLREWQPELSKGKFIKGTDGTSGNSNKFARTYGIWIGPPRIVVIELTDPTYEYYVCNYDGTGNIDGTGFIGWDNLYHQGQMFIDSPRFGVSFRRTDQAALQDSDITAILASLRAYRSTDDTLTTEFAIADAKATGDAINKTFSLLDGAYRGVANEVFSQSWGFTIGIYKKTDGDKASVTGNPYARLTTRATSEVYNNRVINVKIPGYQIMGLFWTYDIANDSFTYLPDLATDFVAGESGLTFSIGERTTTTMAFAFNLKKNNGGEVVSADLPLITSAMKVKISPNQNVTIAEEYDTSDKPYDIDEYVMRSGRLWKAIDNVEIEEAFDASKWANTTVGKELTNVNSSLDIINQNIANDRFNQSWSHSIGYYAKDTGGQASASGNIYARLSERQTASGYNNRFVNITAQGYQIMVLFWDYDIENDSFTYRPDLATDFVDGEKGVTFTIGERTTTTLAFAYNLRKNDGSAFVDGDLPLISGNITVKLSFSPKLVIAEEYDTTDIPYRINAYAMRSGKLWRSIENVETGEAFDTSKWVDTTIGSELTKLYRGLGDLYLGDGTTVGFATTAAVYAAYDALMAKFPDYIHKVSYTSNGFTNYEYVFSRRNYNTFEGLLFVNDGEIQKPKVLLSTSVHGDESNTVAGLYKIMSDMAYGNGRMKELAESIEWHVMPVVVPYTFDNRTRINASGVNINRNCNTSDWVLSEQGKNYSGASPADQVETQAFQQWIDAHTDAILYIDWHNCTSYNGIYQISTFASKKYPIAKLNDIISLKKQYLLALDKVIPYWINIRRLDSSVCSYSDTSGFNYNTNVTGGTCAQYGRDKGIISFTIESGKHIPKGTSGERYAVESKVAIAVGIEVMGNTLLGIQDFFHDHLIHPGPQDN